MADIREIVPLEEGEDGDYEEIDAPVRSGNVITYPSGKIADAKTGDTIRRADGTLVGDVDAGMVNTDDVDSSGYQTAIDISISEPLVAWRGDDGLPYRRDVEIKPRGHYQQVSNSYSYGGTVLVDPTGYRLFQIDETGSLEFVTEVDTGPSGDLDMACPLLGGEWIVFYGTGPHDVYVYSSASDMSSTANAVGSKTGIYGPRTGYDIMTVFDGSNKRWVWGTYNDDADANVIWSADDAGTFTQRATESGIIDSNVRHLQSGDMDPYNQDHLYVTAGDNDDEVYWYKSTDAGVNWSTISGTNGSQDHRTINMAFTEDYVWWASDGFVSSESDQSVLYRAERSSIGSPTKRAELGTKFLSYGVTLDEGHPTGLLIGMRGKDANVDADVPLYWYDIEADNGQDSLRELTKLPNDTTLSAGRGARSMPKRPTDQDGNLYVELYGYDRGPSGSTVTGHRMQIHQTHEGS